MKRGLEVVGCVVGCVTAMEEISKMPMQYVTGRSEEQQGIPNSRSVRGGLFDASTMRTVYLCFFEQTVALPETMRAGMGQGGRPLVLGFGVAIYLPDGPGRATWISGLQASDVGGSDGIMLCDTWPLRRMGALSLGGSKGLERLRPL